MKKFGFIGFIAALIAIIIWQQYKYSEVVKSSQVFASQNKAESEEQYEILQNLHSLQIKYGLTMNFDPNQALVANDGTKTVLSNLITKNSILFYRVKETHCMACVEKELPFLLSLGKAVGNDRVCILLSNQTPNFPKIFMSKYNIPFMVYRINVKELENITSIEDLNVPYTFVVDSSYKSKRLFIPEKFLPDISKNYYDEIAKNMLDKKI